MERQEVTTNDTEQKRKTRSPEDSNELTGDGPARVSIENQSPTDINEEVAVLNLTNRGTQSKSDPPETHNANKKTGTLKNIRKSTSRVILTCEFEGCDKIFSSLQYLNHHVKYQHLQQKSFICSHPTCSESFNIKKRPKEHVKLHSSEFLVHMNDICDKCHPVYFWVDRNYMYEYMHALICPDSISTLVYSAPDITRTVSFFSRCEVCGFTCRQKASLNWHMRKHNAESTYQFPCEICGRRFEKRDNVTVHRSKSHPDYDTPTPELTLPLLPSDPLPHPLEHSRSSPSASKNHTAVE
ncbi:hypothetical protein cypCar_00025363 [Cyprinus carpio]|nr:hypothetical protein cypCar_00025363 [Cyprinus carpio]